MSGAEYRFDGLDAWERGLARIIESQYPAEFRELVIQIARELQTRVKEKTPVRSGILQDSWQVGDIVKRGNTYYIEVYTGVEYAAHVEYGHRKAGGRGFVPGRHMMELSLIEVQARLTPFLRQWLHYFINEHEP